MIRGGGTGKSSIIQEPSRVVFPPTATVPGASPRMPAMGMTTGGLLDVSSQTLAGGVVSRAPGDFPRAAPPMGGGHPRLWAFLDHRTQADVMRDEGVFA